MFDRHYQSTGTEWLLRSLELIRRYPNKFTPDDEELLEAEYAFGISDTHPEAAMKIFRKYYRNRTPERQQDILFLIRFARAAVHANDTSTAREIHGVLNSHQTIRASPNIKIMVDL